MQYRLFYVGFRFFWGKFFRIFLSLILIVASLTISAVGIIVQKFDYTDIARQVYYADAFSKISYLRPDKYMNFAKRDQGEGASLEVSSSGLTRQETLFLEQKLQEIGQGYFLVRHSIGSSAWDIGAFRLFEYFDLNGYDPDVFDPSVFRLYDDNGELAPLFIYYFDPFDEEHIMKPWEEEAAKEQVTCMAVRTFYQGVSVYVGDEKDLELYGYTLHGKLPRNRYEVVIPQSIYNSFAAYGYYDRETGECAEINSFEDIIGKEIEMYRTRETGKTKIVGVLEIDYEKEHIENFLSGPLDSEERILSGNFAAEGLGYGLGPIFDLIVHRSYFDANIPSSWENSSSKRNWYASCATVLKWSEPAIRDAYWEIAAEGLRSVSLFDYTEVKDYIGYSDGQSDVLFQIGQKALKFEPFTWTAYLSIPFTLLLTVYLVYATLYEKRRGMYVLRCMGMRRRQAAWMLLAPVIVFALLAAGLALVGTAAILPQMFSALEINYFAETFVVDIAGFTLTPLSCAYLILWPLVSGLIGVGIAMLSFDGTLRHTRATRPRKKK